MLLKLLLFFFPLSLFCHPICIFIPPDGWEYAVPKNPAYTQALFVGKGKSDFLPNLNLAIEEVDVSLKEYLKAVREIHESEMSLKWRDLGPFTFKAGQGRLGEITSQSPFGEIKMLQAIFVQDGTAYIMTGAALKEEFSAYQTAILSALRSLTLAYDLFGFIKDEAKRSSLLTAFQSFDHLAADERDIRWKELQKTVLEDYASLGGYWHLLVLKEGYQHIFKSNLPAGQKPSSQ
jgi:hypothetical protein